MQELRVRSDVLFTWNSRKSSKRVRYSDYIRLANIPKKISRAYTSENRGELRQPDTMPSEKDSVALNLTSMPFTDCICGRSTLA